MGTPRVEYGMLQWGRSGEGAEDGPTRHATRASAPCFNGAAPVKERKTTRLGGRGDGRETRFNGAAPVKERKTMIREPSAERQGIASMGPLR